MIALLSDFLRVTLKTGGTPQITLREEIGFVKLQPLVENALKHGILPRAGGGRSALGGVAVDIAIPLMFHAPLAEEAAPLMSEA